MSTFDDLQLAVGNAYRLDRELGGGGMSRVFLAEDLALHRQVVLKVLPAELAAVVNVERFNRETLLLARLQHPHIVPVLNVGSLHGLPWFSMPYIEGQSLRARIDQVRKLPIGDVVSVLRDVAKALAYAHERGVVHRDIKPDNILLTGDSATVADFGIAKAVNAARTEGHGQALTQMGMVIGTPAYMSPEQVAGGDAVDQRSDIYALGCVAYEMLCGKTPFADRSFQLVLTAHLSEAVVPITTHRPDVPAALAALVMQCLEKDPALRPQDARDVVQALEQTGIRSGELTTSSSAASVGKTPRVRYAVMGALLLATLGYVGLPLLGVGSVSSLQETGAMAAQERVAITDFAVRGADTLLGRVASDAVRAGLMQSGALTLLTPTEIGDALKRMQRPLGSALSLELMRELAMREGVRAIVDGDLTAVGSQYVLAVRLVTADSGREMTSYRASAESADGLIKMADELSRKLRSRIGESLRTVNAAPSLERVTTTSLDALRRYSEGVHASDVEGNPQRAVGLLRQAVAIDTTFALAWRKLGLVLASTTKNPSAEDSALTTAYRLRERLTDLDAARVEAAYFSAGSRADRIMAIQAYERVLALGDSSVLGNLASIYDSRREFSRAETLRRLVLQRDSGVLRLSALRSTLFSAGRWSAVDSVEAIVRRRFPKDQLNSTWAQTRAGMVGDLEGRRRLLNSAVAQGDVRDPVQTANRQMFLALEEGRLRDADRFREASFAVYRSQGVVISEDQSASLKMENAIDAGAVTPQAVREFEKAMTDAARTSKQSPYLMSARVYAKLGMGAKVLSAYEALKRSGAGSALREKIENSMPTVLIEAAIAERRWTDAASMLRSAEQKPDGPANNCVYCLSLELLRVFATAGMADSALVQYDAYRRTPMGSRPRVGPDLVVSAASMLALARIYDAKGDVRNAVTAYRDYATRFERADAVLQPSVRDARSRIQALTAAEAGRR